MTFVCRGGERLTNLALSHLSPGTVWLLFRVFITSVPRGHAPSFSISSRGAVWREARTKKRGKERGAKVGIMTNWRHTDHNLNFCRGLPSPLHVNHCWSGYRLR